MIESMFNMHEICWICENDNIDDFVKIDELYQNVGKWFDNLQMTL